MRIFLHLHPYLLKKEETEDKLGKKRPTQKNVNKRKRRMATQPSAYSTTPVKRVGGVRQNTSQKEGTEGF